VKAIAADTIHAIADATKEVASHPYGSIQIGSYHDPIGKPGETAMARLEQQIRDLRSKTSKALADRRSNPEQYAGDLSSRFAAMNAFRKRL
jgi:hypothetical protein